MFVMAHSVSKSIYTMISENVLEILFFFGLVMQGDQRILFRSNNIEYYLTSPGEGEPAGYCSVSVYEQNRTVSVGEQFYR